MTISGPRSRGVTVYATYAVILGTLGVVLNATTPWLARRMGQAAAIQPLGVAIGVGLGVLLLAAGVGAVRLKPWGRWLALLTAVGHLLVLARDYPVMMAAAVPVRIGYLTSGAIELVVLWFFTRPAVVAQFRRVP